MLSPGATVSVSAFRKSNSVGANALAPARGWRPNTLPTMLLLAARWLSGGAASRAETYDDVPREGGAGASAAAETYDVAFEAGIGTLAALTRELARDAGIGTSAPDTREPALLAGAGTFAAEICDEAALDAGSGALFADMRD